jgi:tetratricopeptide (TPR) repeat protein
LNSAELGQLLALLRAGRHAELERGSRDLLIQHPQAGLIWKLLSVSLWMQGKNAMQALEMAAKLLPNDAEAQSNLGNALRAARQLEGAVSSHRRAVDIDPGYAEAHNNLGCALRDLGRFEEAMASFRRAVESKQDFAMAHGNLGGTLQHLGQFEAAAAGYRRALGIAPDNGDFHRNLGDVLLELGRPDEAGNHYRRALELKPGVADMHSKLGMVLMLQGRAAEAEERCSRALDMNPELPGAHVLLAQIDADKGRFAEAEAHLQRAIAIDPDMPEAWAGLARWRKMTRADAAWLSEAQRVVARRLPPRREAHLRYALGKYFDDVKDFEQAFTHYRRANELTKRGSALYDSDEMTRCVDRVIRLHDREWLRRNRIAGTGSERAVFIVGMWRSGTTLAEQILASHPSVFGAGELTFWKEAPRRLQTGNAVIGELAGEYLTLLGKVSADAVRVVDKMSANFLHLGLIHAALPNARIIHLRRNPIDTCLSIYFQDFVSAHSYANDLEDVAHYYAQYHRIMQHWRQTLPKDAILDVSYEQLVHDQEGWSRAMCEFVGLDWDPRCMDFHRTHRTVTTASKWQVRQAISKSSVERWRNYEKYVEPLLSLLELNSAAVSSGGNPT